jgi:uncharacterized short protein YbdD (DUF466 family)
MEKIKKDLKVAIELLKKQYEETKQAHLLVTINKYNEWLEHIEGAA